MNHTSVTSKNCQVISEINIIFCNILYDVNELHMYNNPNEFHFIKYKEFHMSVNYKS